MEHRIDLEYSKKELRKQIEFRDSLLFHIKPDHIIAKNLHKEKLNYEKCLAVLEGKEVEDYDPEIPITQLRSHLEYLNRQLSVVPGSQRIIDEIEYVTNLLDNGKS
jgi:hypothetical protein